MWNTNQEGCHLSHNDCKHRSYTTIHMWNKTLMWCEKSIGLPVLPTATIHTIVTNSSQPLMESIKPCKYLQDKRASRQSIPIYRTMEGSTVAMFQVRKINKVSFGNRREKNVLHTHHSLFYSYALSFLPSFWPLRCFLFFSKFDIAGCASQQVSETAGNASRKVVGDSIWRREKLVDVTVCWKPGR